MEQIKTQVVKKRKSNPYNANQWSVDPRQNLFLSYYLDPKSSTFSSGLASALKAGYTQTYAETLLGSMPTWLSESLRNSLMLQKAERNLDNILDLETREAIITLVGVLKDENGNVLKKENANLLRTKADVSKFIAERLNKIKYGKGEEEVKPPVTNNFMQIVINNNADNRKQA